MTREERRIYQLGVFVAAVLIVAIVMVLTEGCAKIEAYAAEAVQFEEEVEKPSEAPEKADFDANSAMPCVDREAFWRWYESYSASSETVGSEPEATEPALYRIAGEEVDADLQIRLYHHLEEAGIPDWFTGALAQMYQESHCKQYAENPNGLDKGIFQYRITYWNWSDGDIFDLDAQMSKYASEMAARFGSGLSVDEAISRHKTSDYVTSVDWTYVAQCKQWLGQLEVVE